MIRAGRGRRGRPEAEVAQPPEPAGQAAPEPAGAIRTAAPGPVARAAADQATGRPAGRERASSGRKAATSGREPATSGAAASGTAASGTAASGAAASASVPATGSAPAVASAPPVLPARGARLRAASAERTAAPRHGSALPAADQPPREADQPGDAPRARRRPVRTALRATGRGLRWAFGRRWAWHVALLLCYIGAGIGVTWPRFSYLWNGQLPASPDVSSYVWALWWVAHQLGQVGNPWFTSYMAAPAGIQLGFNTLMPLPAVLFAPVTAWWGPSASFTVLTVITPGLACYAMFRAARLWLNMPAAIAAGALFGLSSMLDWQNWYHVNLSLGTVFLPLTLEAAVRLRRGPTTRRGIWLGLVLASSILVNQESTVLAIFLTAAILLPRLAGLAWGDRAALRAALPPLGVGAAVAALVASPQLIAMAQQALSGGASVPARVLAANATRYGVGLPTLFAPSPRLASYGLGHLAASYSYSAIGQDAEALPTFGAVLTALALLGAVTAWRRRSTWGFAGLWLSCAALALGSSLVIGTHAYYPLQTHEHMRFIQGVTVHGVHHPAQWAPITVSNLMPFSWLMRVPGLSGLREADRFALLGLVGAAMLAGLAVQWLTKHARLAVAVPVLIAIAGLAFLEAGWNGDSGPGYHGSMPTTFGTLDGPLLADHTRSLVVDVPYGLRGGLNLTGAPIPIPPLVMSTKDGHQRAVSYTSWVPEPTIKAVLAHPFFAELIAAESNGGEPTCASLAARRRAHPSVPAGRCFTVAQLRAAHRDAMAMHIGWALEWRTIWKSNDPGLRYSNMDDFLGAVGFTRVHKELGNPVWFYHLWPATRAGLIQVGLRSR